MDKQRKLARHANTGAIKMAKLFSNCGDPDQMPHSAQSDLGLCCLSFTFLRGLQTKIG